MVGAKTPLSWWLVPRHPIAIRLGHTGEVARSGFAQSEEKNLTILPGTTQCKERGSENRLFPVLHGDRRRGSKQSLDIE